MAGKRWTIEEERVLQRDYVYASPDSLLLLIPGRTWDSIKIHALSLNLKKTNQHRKQSDLSILLDNTPQSYYWMGFLLADGHFSETRVSLGLSKKDYHHVKAFANFIKAKQIRKSPTAAAMDVEIVPKIRAKFGITNRKTYEPSKIDCHDDNLFISLVIGIIDGDGNISHQTRREDCFIRIKCHKTWLDNLQKISNRLAKILSLKPNIAEINKQGYANIYFSNSIIVKFIKKKVIELNLPVLKRKWNKIDENWVGKAELGKIRVVQVKKLLVQNYKQTIIAKMLGISNSAVSMIVKRNNL